VPQPYEVYDGGEGVHVYEVDDSGERTGRVAIFAGPDAIDRAEQYADWRECRDDEDRAYAEFRARTRPPAGN
jgi:hypothetical protein